MSAEELNPHHRATIVVIGGGQAGLSAGYYLQQRGYTNALLSPGAPLTYIILGAAEGPGGAWRHRWESLTMSTVNQIFDLPRHQQSPVSPDTPRRVAVPAYFASFEEANQLALARDVSVLSVHRSAPGSDSRFTLTTTQGIWVAQAIINATGTWNNPIIPIYPGQGSFTGWQLHTRDYSSYREFAGQRVAIVGGGISAIQHLEEISRVAETFWYTRREPVFISGEFSAEHGRDVITRV